MGYSESLAGGRIKGKAPAAIEDATIACVPHDDLGGVAGEAAGRFRGNVDRFFGEDWRQATRFLVGASSEMSSLSPLFPDECSQGADRR